VTELAIRLLGPDDVESYIDHTIASNAESGREGDGHSHVYDRATPYDRDQAVVLERKRWSADVSGTDWRRAWGLFDGVHLVGHVHLAGGALPSECHRVNLGMGILRTHRRRGGGRRLVEVAVAWARSQAHIDWIDLGVFHDNTPARALYESLGFSAVGTTRDRFRVDGVSLDDTAMTLRVADCRQADGGP
jgi:ribosomal protein S18 acetylase RimI-like enzyme